MLKNGSFSGIFIYNEPCFSSSFLMLTRFAPSPTGYLHIGNARTALVSWLYVRQNKGKFILRFDDTDLQRVKDEYIEDIRNSLRWLNIDWDDAFCQSSRVARYDEVFASLLRKKIVYPCYETKDELDFQRKIQLKNKLPPIYDRYSLKISDKQKNVYLSEGRSPYFRFKITDNIIISWNDIIRGDISFDTRNISDPIIKRSDGSYTYMLPSVIDDLDYDINHIIRGEDHITNTAIQIDMCNALKGRIPTFSHLSLLYINDSKISKRVGGQDIRSFIYQGLESMTLNNYLAKIGTSEAISMHTDMITLIDSFEIKKFNQAPTKLSIDDLLKLNSKILGNLSFVDVKQRLFEFGISSEDFWNSVKNNIEVFSKVQDWWNICKKSINPVIDMKDKNYIKLSLSLLPEDDWNEKIWNKWINEIKKNTDRKGQELFKPLRIALTGKDSGPELANLLPIIGREEVINRLTLALI